MFPIEEGISPDKLLLPRNLWFLLLVYKDDLLKQIYKLDNCARLPIDEGIWPVNALWLRYLLNLDS